ncbi:MAG: hypothetical protein OSJ74_04820 [Clostridia bacterium]|nr:hypothetical protein [Clostridia bacterium]
MADKYYYKWMAQTALMEVEERRTLLKFAISVGDTAKIMIRRLLNGQEKEKSAFIPLYNEFLNSVGYDLMNKYDCQYLTFELTQERKEFLLKQSKIGDKGAIALGAGEGWSSNWYLENMYKDCYCLFEDTAVIYNDKIIAESTSHDEYFAVDFDEDLKERFLMFENQKDRNALILSKLKKCQIPNDLEGKSAKVTVVQNVLRLELSDGRTVEFKAYSDKYNVLINDYADDDGEFVNGEVYTLRQVNYDVGIQLFGNIFDCDTELDLNCKDGRRCHINLVADEIYVDVVSK